MKGISKNTTNAANQQGSLFLKDPSETTRRAPLSEKAIKAYLLGCLHDGTYSSNKRYRFSQKGKEWLKVLQVLLRRIGYNSWIYCERKENDLYVLETLADFLDFFFNPLKLESKKEKRAYLRGFFDAEGGTPKNSKDRFYIQLTQRDKIKIIKIKKILYELGIRTGKIHNPSMRVDPNYWRIYVLANSQKLFLREIGSWHPRKIKVLRKRMVI